MPNKNAPTLRRDVVDAHGHKSYYVASPLRRVGALIPEPLHDYIVKERLGGTHGATSRLTAMLWDKLFEFVTALDLPQYSTPAHYATLLRKLGAARLAYDPRLTDNVVPQLHRGTDSDAVVGEPHDA